MKTNGESFGVVKTSERSFGAVKTSERSFGVAKKIACTLCLILAGCAGGGEQHMIQQAESSAKVDAQYRARVHTELAASYYSLGQYGVALEELNDALRSDSSYTPAYNMLGVVYMELKEDKQAEQAYEQALRISPSDSETHNNYGWFLCTRGRMGLSIGHFLEAVKNPLYATPERAYLNAGICSRKQGNDSEAEKYFLSALKIQPLQQQVLYNIADLYFSQARFEDARLHLDRHLRVAAATADSLWLAVRIDRKLHDRNAEASHGLQLRKQFPDSPQADLLKSGRFD